MLKLNYLFTLIFFLSSNCLAQSGYEILDLELTNKLPYIKLQVENEQARCLLDTGARNQVLVLDKDILAKLTTIIPFPVKDRGLDITGKIYLAKKYILPKFNIGQLSFIQTRVAEDTNWGLTTAKFGENSNQKDGVVGLELFQEKAIIIDYPKQKLVIINETIPADYDVDNWQKLDFKLDRFGIAIYARIDGGDYKRFILDSGSNISLIRPNSVGLNKIENNCDAILTPGKECSAIKTQNFIINGIDSGSMFFYLYSFEEPAADGILGYDFLADKAIYIDFKKRIMRLLQRK